MASLEIAEDKEVKLLEVFEFTVPSLQFCSPLCIRLRHFFSPSHYFLFHLLSLLPDPPPLFPPVIRYLLLLDIFLSQVGINVKCKQITSFLIRAMFFAYRKGIKGKDERESGRAVCWASIFFFCLVTILYLCSGKVYTNNTWLGLGSNHGLAQNTCFGHQYHRWR